MTAAAELAHRFEIPDASERAAIGFRWKTGEEAASTGARLRMGEHRRGERDGRERKARRSADIAFKWIVMYR